MRITGQIIHPTRKAQVDTGLKEAEPGHSSADVRPHVGRGSVKKEENLVGSLLEAVRNSR